MSNAGKATATRLGSYEILHMFAKGGMAELFLARSIALEGFEKLVVLKRILPSFAQNTKFVRLFLDEAKLAASLDHPSIAHVYDLGKVDGDYFFTMEYVHGQDVRCVLQRSAKTSPLPIDHVVQIGRSVASALHYAHERRAPDGKVLGIVHRDVSPSNIVVSYEGAVKLLDFGVAKAATSTVKTRTGTLKGKVAYMSPEQAKGLPIDRRSDVFSAGIVMWEMVATQRLFKAQNDLATLQLVINRVPPSLCELRSDCPAELDRIIQRALEQDPAARYQTAQEMQSDLDELARELKLNQSTIALSQHMGLLFAPEIAAWKEAQASGVSLVDHVVAASETRTATPSDDPFAESEEDESVGEDPMSASGDEEEQTVRTSPPKPVQVPVIRKRKKAKEPKDWKSAPSIVVEQALLEADAVPAAAPEGPNRPTPPPGTLVRPSAPAIEAPDEPADVVPIRSQPPIEVDLATPLPRRIESSLPTQIVAAVPDPFANKSRAGIWIAAGLVVVGVAVAMFIKSRGEPAAPNPAPEPVVAEPSPPVVEPPPPAVAKPVDEVAKPEVVKAEPPEPKREVATKRPAAKPKPTKPKPTTTKKPKFDPDAPLPPM